MLHAIQSYGAEHQLDIAVGAMLKDRDANRLFEARGDGAAELAAMYAMTTA